MFKMIFFIINGLGIKIKIICCAVIGFQLCHFISENVLRLSHMFKRYFSLLILDSK